MPANYSSAARHARLNICLNAVSQSAGVSVNGHTGTGGDGQLVIGTSGLSGSIGVLATITLTPTTPFSFADFATTPPTTVASLTGGTISVAPSAPGTAALAELRDGGGITVMSGLTVGTVGTDVLVSTTAFTTSINVQVNAISITTQ